VKNLAKKKKKEKTGYLVEETFVDASNVHVVKKGLVNEAGVRQARMEIERAKRQEHKKKKAQNQQQ